MVQVELQTVALGSFNFAGRSRRIGVWQEPNQALFKMNMQSSTFLFSDHRAVQMLETS